MSQYKTYVRRQPETVQARPLSFNEINYDAHGDLAGGVPGDMLVRTLTDTYVLGREMFDKIWVEVKDGDPIDQDLPSSEPTDLRER